MIRWMYGVKFTDRLSCVELRQQVGIKYIEKAIRRNRLQWHENVLRKNDDDWVKNVLLWRLREPDKEIGPGKHAKRSCTMICT